MVRFDVSKYATVAERLQLVADEYPDYRIITEEYSTVEDRANGVWRVKATLFLNVGDQAAGLPKATGHAFEIDGTPGANTTSALENAETSAIGRCLAIAGWSGNKDDASRSLASREEMGKVERGVPVAPIPEGFEDLVSGASDVDVLKKLWDDARKGGFANRVTTLITDRKKELEG